MFLTFSETYHYHHHHKRILPILTRFLHRSRGLCSSSSSNCSHLTDHLLRLSTVSPETSRKFYGASSLNPEDVYSILRGFESTQRANVESLWGIFTWATEQNPEFQHLPCSCKIMLSMLSRSGLHQEAEILLSRNEIQGVLLDCGDVFSDLIQGYLRDFRLDKAVSVYQRSRRLHLVPRMSCYVSLIEYLVELNQTQKAYDIYMDLVHLGIERRVEIALQDGLIRLLCVGGKVQEARDLVRNAMKYVTRPSASVVSSITFGYCDKKDYDDIVSFYAEAGVSPDVVLGNRILYSVCQNLGVDQADKFLQKLEDLGFCPDEISLGILISFSCHEGNLRRALFYVSDIVARGLKPNLLSYNALLSGVFKEGMWMHYTHILAEINDSGVTPDTSTFRVIIAGLCRARRFEEVKATVHEMSELNLIQLSPLEDPLSKGFMLVGLNPLSVKIKRDNDKESFRAEFYDSLGNGLYLDTNIDEFERIINQVLNDGMLPDFNSLVIDECDGHCADSIPRIVEETVRWGQEMSLPAYSSFLSYLCRSKFSISTINCYLGSMSKPVNDLHEGTLNLLIQAYSNEGLTFKSRMLIDGMVERRCTIYNKTFSVLYLDTCQKGDLQNFQDYQELAQKYNWTPEAKHLNPILTLMCQRKWFKEAMELFRGMTFANRCDLLDSLNLLVKELSSQGFTSGASLAMQEFHHEATDLSHEACNSLLLGFCQEKKFTSAFEILAHMLSRGISPSTDAVTRLVHHLCKTKNFEKALELQNKISGDPLHRESVLIKEFCKFGNVEGAACILQHTLLINSFPDHTILNSLIVGYSGSCNCKRVKETLGFMIRKKSSILISSYSNLVRLLSAEGKISLCFGLKQLMLHVTDLPEIVLYNVLIFHVSSTRSRFLLNSVIDSFLQKGLHFDAATYNFLIRGFLLCNDLPESVKYLKAMLKQDLPPSNRSLREVIDGLCCTQELELALNLSQEMESRGWVHGSVIQISIGTALITNGMFHEAVEFLSHITSKGLSSNKVQHDHLIKQMCSHNKLDEAVDLLNLMIKKESSPESSSYDCIIQGFCRGHKLDRALDFSAEMLCKELKPSMITWDALIRNLTESDRIHEAENLLKSMLQLGETPPRQIFCYLINKYRSLNNNSRTSEIMKLMQQAGHTPDFDTHWSLVTNLSSSSSSKKNLGNSGFLSRLVSGVGFTIKR